MNKAKVQAFFTALPALKVDVLSDVDYIFVGPRESRLAGGPVTLLLPVVYQANGITIYQWGTK
jgi:hypothetical protein